jgi:defect in organelle trafficking protein DotD
MIRLVLLLLIAAISIAGCAKTPTGPASVQPKKSINAKIALAEAATSVSHSINQLNATEQAANPPLSISNLPNPATYGMNIPASLNWTGPVEAIARSIAQAADYHFRVLGARPSAPVIVSVTEHNSNLGLILQNIGLQCRKNASIVILPKSKTIELRYLQRS